MLLSKYKREPEAWNKHVVPYFESGATSRCSSVLWVRGYIIIANTVHLFRLNPWLLELDSSKKEWDSLAKNALNDSERERALPEADTGVAEYRCADLTKKTSRNFPTLLAHLQKSRESGSILEAFFKQNSAVNSRSWWWKGRPGVLRFMGLQRVGHDWATDLISSDLKE